ncbi:MAG: DUF4097 family beta strand repeat protein [Clostridiales bacterium]|nr:DUF4097 family beta strand repeat protein [Clostridiales bacterium]
MKPYQRRLLTIALALIVAGAAVIGIGYAITQNNKESSTMENQSYQVSEINAIQINTDTPNVVITPTDGDKINLSWQTDDYVEYKATLTDGELSVEYRIDTNWLKSLFKSWLSGNEYILEIELPNAFKGALDVSTVSGKIIADTSAALDHCSLTSVSGRISAVNITSKADVRIRSTSGETSADTVQAEGDLSIQTVSGSVSFFKSTAMGGMEIKTTSGGVTAAELSAAAFYLKTTSGRVELSQLQCEGDVTLESVSGSLQLADVSCAGFAAKTVSGGIHFHGLTADTIELKGTSGSINGSVNGTQDEYGVSVSTVSGKSNLQNAAGSGGKKLTLSTVSGGIEIQFEGGGE